MRWSRTPAEVPVPVKIMPTRRADAASLQAGQTLGRGMDFALVVLVFLGIGYAIDRWLGTRPWLLLVFLTLGMASGILSAVREAKRVGAGS